MVEERFVVVKQFTVDGLRLPLGGTRSQVCQVNRSAPQPSPAERPLAVLTILLKQDAAVEPVLRVGTGDGRGDHLSLIKEPASIDDVMSLVPQLAQKRAFIAARHRIASYVGQDDLDVLAGFLEIGEVVTEMIGEAR